MGHVWSGELWPESMSELALELALFTDDNRQICSYQRSFNFEKYFNCNDFRFFLRITSTMSGGGVGVRFES